MITLEALDKKLLLCIQVACNQDGTKIPWDKVGQFMNDNNTGGPITEGAIVQHLAKLRVRMINENLPVPPPLKRGGLSRISTVSTAGAGTTRSPTAAATPRLNSGGRAQRRLSAAQSANTSGALNDTTLGKASEAKSKTKKARKSMSDDDMQSEVEEFDTDDSDGEYGKPVTRHAKISDQGYGRRLGKQKIKVESGEEEVEEEEDDDEGEEEEDEDEVYSKSSEAGEKRKRGGAHNDKLVDAEVDGQDGYDKTVSGIVDDYVGSHASFLPVESVHSSPSSQAEKSLMIALKWGKAYRGHLASYQVAQLKLIEAGVLPNLPPEEDSDEEDHGEEDQGVSVTNCNYTTGETEDNVEFPSFIGQPDALAHLDNGHVDPQVFGSDQTNFPSQQIFNFPDASTHAYQPRQIGLTSDNTVLEHGQLTAGLFGELVHTPLEMSFSHAGPVFHAGSRFVSGPQYNPGCHFNPGMHGSWIDNFDPTNGVGLDLGSSNGVTYTHGAFQGAWPDHGLSRYNSDTTNTTQSSSVEGSINTEFPHVIPIDPIYGAGATTLNTDGENLRPQPSHYDPEDEDHTTQFDTGFKWAVHE